MGRNVGVRAEELVLRRGLADGDRDDTDGAGAFHAVQIAAQGAEFFFVRIKLLLLLRGDAGVTDVGGVRLGFR